jgi:hypothetical protein
MSQEIDDLDAMITKAVLEAESVIEKTPEMEAAWKKAVEILKAVVDKQENNHE